MKKVISLSVLALFLVFAACSSESTTSEAVVEETEHACSEACSTGTHKCGEHCKCGDGCECATGATCSAKCDIKEDEV